VILCEPLGSVKQWTIGGLAIVLNIIGLIEGRNWPDGWW